MKRSRTRDGGAPSTPRSLRVAEQIRHVLVEALQRESFHDPDLADAHRITVTAVDIGPDLAHAVVFVMPLGGEKADSFLEALNRSSGLFRSEIARRMDLRYAPKITFRLDQSFDEAARIENLLRQERVLRDVQKDDGQE